MAFVVWLVLVLALAVATVLQASHYTSQPPDQHVPATGGTVVLAEPGNYTVYAESDPALPGRWPDVGTVVGPDGRTIAVTRSSFSETYTVGDRSGIRLGTFAADRPGPYRLVGRADGTALGDELVVSTRTVGAILAIVGSAAVTVFVLVAGLITFLVLHLVGRRHRRAQGWGPAPAFPAPASGPGPPYPGPPGPPPGRAPGPPEPPPGAGDRR